MWLKSDGRIFYERDSKKIVVKHGKEILANKKKFISIFSDEAPRMKTEKKLLEIALSEDIAEIFLNCPENDRKAGMLRARRKLEKLMSDDGINEVLNSFSYALNWKEKASILEEKKIIENKVSTEKNVKNNETEKNKERKQVKKNDKIENKSIETQDLPNSSNEKKSILKLTNIIRIIGILAYAVLGPLLFYPEENVIIAILLGAFTGLAGYYLCGGMIYALFYIIVKGAYSALGKNANMDKFMDKFGDGFFYFFTYFFFGWAIIAIIAFLTDNW